MLIKHIKLIEKGKDLLRKKGFKNKEIHTEYEVNLGNGRFQRIDVVGITKSNKVAIECGGVNKNIEPLKKIFDEVIIIPYVKVQGNRYHCYNCNHQWTSRVEKPQECPKCKRYFQFSERYDWDKDAADKK